MVDSNYIITYINDKRNNKNIKIKHEKNIYKFINNFNNLFTLLKTILDYIL